MAPLLINMSKFERARLAKYESTARENLRRAAGPQDFQNKLGVGKHGLRDKLEASDLVHDLEASIGALQKALSAAKKAYKLLDE